MQKAWKKKSAVYVPFVVLFLVELWIHKGIVPDFGDDLWFKEVACSEGFSFLTWLHQRYMEWSSRTAIELLLMITVRAPLYFWRIVDSALITCVAIFLSKMAIQKTEDSIYINTITSMLVEFCRLDCNDCTLFVAAQFWNYGAVSVEEIFRA